jgi:aminoglycoside phosphotransferase (APT) family kinase protein
VLGLKLHVAPGQLALVPPHLAQLGVERVHVAVGVGKHEPALSRPLVGIPLPRRHKRAARLVLPIGPGDRPGLVERPHGLAKPALGQIARGLARGGQSNPTFFASLGDSRLVVRKKPAGQVLPSAHAVDREFRVISALATTAVPVPRALLFCDDTSVVGTPFYVMQRLDGRVFHDAALPGITHAERRAMYLAMAETLARLHDIDPAEVGLADYGRPGNYFERQVKRWSGQYQAARWRDLPDLDHLISWLPANLPPEEPTRLCHGDFRIGNLMFHPTEPRVIGVLDWELSTLGQPLADVAFSAIGWLSAPTKFAATTNYLLTIRPAGPK